MVDHSELKSKFDVGRHSSQDGPKLKRKRKRKREQATEESRKACLWEAEPYRESTIMTILEEMSDNEI